MVAPLQMLEVGNLLSVMFTHVLPGSTFCYRPNGLMVNSPTGHRSIYSPKANVTKAAFYKVYPLKANVPNTWQCIDNAKHARKRRILNYFFFRKSNAFCGGIRDPTCRSLVRASW